YQTIYAKEEGAVAAPTAGLHFSKHLLKRLEIKGIDFAEVTLHVGLGTFNPVEVEDLSKHKMDSEELIISQEACDIVNSAKVKKKKICCIGTTSMRAIESSVSSARTMNPYTGWTNKFIFPPYDFSIADCMVTNFHTPKSTLLMMVSAFCGHDLMKKAYEEAIKEKYRFYSYGDAMLII
ncbi:MAG: tRNA preQ1(34) S-adenosylmethionine ribosyltransferase-isomerase QueA, partial [Flavobacterium sp.]|uniref:S-adenosylmethionine:tRNA ribosyltransferase-isomerase n=2 Tax=Flavobacterium TaxID=237 RepID=UPI0025BDF16B